MTGGEDRLDAEPVEMRGDLRAAAVHDDRPQAGVAEEHDVLGERALQRVVDHGVAAELDDDGPSVELLEPRQRLDEDADSLQRGGMAAAHVEYAEFSCT